jgi:hypothetical protein
MIKHLLIICVFLITFTIIVAPFAQDKEIFFREEFNNLEHWKPLHFPKIKNHTKYSIERDGDGGYLKAKSNASASGIIFKEEFNVFEYPKVIWRWKVSNVFKKGNAKKKSGDDYPLRVYIIFKYNSDTASFGQKIKYGLAKAIYGEYPPHSSLNYIWANKQHNETIITNPYASEAKMLILQTGKENADKWIEQEIDIIKDYRIAFDKDPPAIGSFAIMSDSDNTGESAFSYIDYIEVGR